MMGLPRRFRHLFSHGEPNTVIIAIPGLFGKSPDEWFDHDHAWLSLVPDGFNKDLAVLSFDHGLELDENRRLWDNVLAAGDDLLEVLVDLKQSKQYESSCVIYIAHSVGGVILKRCLNTMASRPGDFSLLLVSTVGVVLAATPHTTLQDSASWNFLQPLGALRSRWGKLPPCSPSTARQLAQLCQDFVRTATEVPVLTFIETRESSLKGRGFGSRTKAMIVEADKSRCHSRLEVAIPIEASHLEIVHEIPRDRVRNFLQRPLMTCASNISRELRQGTPPQSLTEINFQEYNRSLEHEPPSQTPSSNDLSNIRDGPVSETRQEAMMRLTDFSTVRRDPILPCHLISSQQNPYFGGREDILRDVENALIPPADEKTDSSASLRTYALVGSGGVGKSQIATEFAFSRKDVYDAIFWVRAEDYNILSSDFSRIAEELGLVLGASAEARDHVVTRELVKGWLANPVHSYSDTRRGDSNVASWLLIFDNVPDSDVLLDFWPPDSAVGSLLITSRDPLAKTPYYSVSAGCVVPMLSTEAASQLLLRRTWRTNLESEMQSSRKVAERLGGLPLAIVQMAGVMVRKDLSCEEFLQEIGDDDSHAELFSLSLQPASTKDNYSHTLASVWSLDGLEYGAGLLDVLSLLDPDRIPETILKVNSTAVALHDYPNSTRQYHDARSELLKSSLISRDSSSTHLSIHRLLQDNARARMSSERLLEAFETAIDLIHRAWPSAGYGVRHAVARWKACDALVPHIIRLKEHYMKYTTSGKVARSNSVDLADLIGELGWYLQEQARSDEALECAELAQSMLNNMLSRHPLGAEEEARARLLLAESHNNTAGSACETNNAKLALHHFRIYNKLLVHEFAGMDEIPDARLTSSYFNIGLSLLMDGQYVEAKERLLYSLEEAKRIKDPALAFSTRSLPLTNLALACWLNGEVRKASSYLETALLERESFLGVNDRQSMITGRILYGLGNVREAQGKLQESLAFHERALLHFKETVGSRHHRTGNSCFKVAKHYLQLARHEETESLIMQGLKVFGDRKCYRGERARMLFLKKQYAVARGSDMEASLALREAFELYLQVAPQTQPVRAEQLEMKDFDAIIHVWGR